jgi:hypothetical protein
MGEFSPFGGAALEAVPLRSFRIKTHGIPVNGPLCEFTAGLTEKGT